MPAFDRQKWDAKYAAPHEAPSEPSAVLVSLDNHLPRSGLAIDIAGGAGRNAIWLAQRGLDVTIADISPVGLALSRERSAAAGLTLQTVEIDLETAPFPDGPWDLIVSVCYLHRPLFAKYPLALAPGGILAVIQPTKKNLERHDKPPSAYLLDEGELLPLFKGLQFIHYQEGWLADNRHDAIIIAQKSRSE